MFSPAFYPGWGLNSFIAPPKPIDHSAPGPLIPLTEGMKERVREEKHEKSSDESASDKSCKKSHEDMNDTDGSSGSESDTGEPEIDTSKMDPTHREILEKLKRQEREEREEIERELRAHKEALARHEEVRKAHLKDLHEKELKAAHAAVTAAQKLHSPNSAEELRHKRPPLDRASFDYLNALYMDRAFAAARVSPPTSEPTSEASGSHHWTFEEQFKQLYELSEDPKRKEFLDDLFSYMQKRGTPVNRIPIMAKQTLDLYQLFKLVVSKGGLVEVINKKLWREITKGLNLPSSITSAAFTLRTQYMKYLYPYECEKLKLSSPSELQAAIDGNRREGRRSSYGYEMSPGAPTLVSPHMNGAFFNGLGALNGHMNGHLNGFGSPPMALCPKPPITTASSDDDRTPPSSPPHDLSTRNKIAMEVASRAMEEAAKKMDTVSKAVTSEEETPVKKQKVMSEEDRLLAHAGMPSAHLKVTSRTDGREMDNSLVVSMEINGIMYQGVLFAQPPRVTCS